MSPNPPHRPLLVRSLTISTKVPVHLDFVADPIAFTHSHGVRVADGASTYFDFKHDPETYVRNQTPKANIHLGQHRAIRLFIKNGDVLSIDLNPSLLLHGAQDHPLIEQDLPRALSVLRDTVAPLLADPADVVHIVPGHRGDAPHVAYWSGFEASVLLSGVNLRCFHQVSHPAIGFIERGSKRLKLFNEDGSRVICFEKLKTKSTGPDDPPGFQGVRVGLCIEGNALAVEFASLGGIASVSGTKRLVAFGVSDMARVFQTLMARLQGFYLPVPTEWENRVGKPLTPARVIALLSVITPIPIRELQSMYEKSAQPSRATLTRLKKEMRIEAARLKKVPLSTLFEPALFAPGRGI